MNPAEKEQVENEVNAARQMQRQKAAWLDEFFERKDLLLWDAFKSVPLRDKDALVDIHHAAKSLESLRQEIQTVMDSGKLAQAALNLEA